MVEFKNYNLGVNLSKSDKQLSPGELLAATNWKYGDFGRLITREGVKRLTTSALASSKFVKHLAYVPGSTSYMYAVTDDYKIYKITGSEPTLAYNSSLKTLEGDAVIVPFNGYGIVLDGSYIKTVQGDTVAMAYDDGTEGFFYTNHCGENDASTNLYSGSVTRLGSLVTTPTWDEGYTMPLTQIEIWLSKTGSPTGTITAYIYNSVGDTLLGTSTDTLESADLTTNGAKKKFAFETPYNMERTTAYIFCIGYSGGDSSNYITVHATSEASGGKQQQYAGSWAAVTTKSPLIAIKPAMPPKGSFGDVKDTRIFIAGDPDNPGKVWFSNTGTVFDWSTAFSAGYVGAVDDDANNFAVGMVVAHFGDLYVIGKKEQPYVCKLTGSTPEDFSLPPLFQYMSATHKTLLSVVNDIWCVSDDAVNSLSGVQEYGDVRAFSEGDPVKNKVRDYFGDDSFAGYNPADGQFLLKMAGYDNILVCHTKHAAEVDGKKRYPWTDYLFKNLTPSAFASFNNKFYLPCTDGHLYRLDSTIVKDNGTLPDYTLTSGIEETPFNIALFDSLYAQIDSASWSLDYKTDISFDETAGVYTINSAGSDFETASLGTGVKFKLTGSTNNDGVFTVSSTATTTAKITVTEAVTDEAAGGTISISLDYGNLDFYKNGSSSSLVTKYIKANNSPRREKIRFNMKSIQWSLNTLTLSNQLRFNGIQLEAKQIGAKI